VTLVVTAEFDGWLIEADPDVNRKHYLEPPELHATFEFGWPMGWVGTDPPDCLVGIDEET